MRRTLVFMIVGAGLVPSTGGALQTADDTIPERVVDRAVQAFIRHDAAAYVAEFDSVYYFQDLEPARVAAAHPGAPRRMRTEELARRLREAWEKPGPRGPGHVDLIQRLVAGRFVVNHLAIRWDTPQGAAQSFEKLEIYEVRNGRIIAEYDGQYVGSGRPKAAGSP